MFLTNDRQSLFLARANLNSYKIICSSLPKTFHIPHFFIDTSYSAQKNHSRYLNSKMQQLSKQETLALREKHIGWVVSFCLLFNNISNHNDFMLIVPHKLIYYTLSIILYYHHFFFPTGIFSIRNFYYDIMWHRRICWSFTQWKCITISNRFRNIPYIFRIHYMFPQTKAPSNVCQIRPAWWIMSCFLNVQVNFWRSYRSNHSQLI